MSAKYFVLDPQNPDIAAVRECARIIKSGGLVTFPTETVYGIGTNAFDAKGVERLFFAKKRPLDKPLLCHVNGLEQARCVGMLDSRAISVISSFTPGPLTLVVKKQPSVPSVVTSNGDTVGLRFPSNKLFLMLSAECGVPIAATSANISGFESAKDSGDLASALEISDAVIDCGKCEYSLESTILSLVDEPRVLREGAFSKQKLLEVLAKCC